MVDGENPEKTPASRTPSRSLGASARASLLWGGGFTLLRDIAQFAVMLLLVRLLSPADYGLAALAQSFLGVAAIFSYSTFSTHALQMREPGEIDWQTHFTFACLLNAAIFALLLIVSFGVSFTESYHQAAAPLAALGLALLIDAPGTMRARMLESRHDWKRFRLQLIAGTVLGLTTGVIVALMGGGVWALIVQPPLLGLPAAYDLFFVHRFRPDWSLNRARLGETLRFGLDQLGSGLVGRGRALTETMIFATFYSLATLGVYTRTVGLATLIAGRIGSITMMALHPVITRAEPSLARFQRLAALLLRGVAWVIIPAATFLAIAAHDVVLLLYGPKWAVVASLLPLAAASTCLVGAWNVLSSVLVANNNSRQALWIDVTAGLSAIVLAFLLITYGPGVYLAGLMLHGMACCAYTAAALMRTGAMTSSGVAAAAASALIASASGAAAVKALHALGGEGLWPPLCLAGDGALFAGVYLLTLRLLFRPQLSELLSVAPGGAPLARWMKLTPTQ